MKLKTKTAYQGSSVWARYPGWFSQGGLFGLVACHNQMEIFAIYFDADLNRHTFIMPTLFADNIKESILEAMLPEDLAELSALLLQGCTMAKI